MQEALLSLQAAIAELRRGGNTRELSAEEVERVFGLGFGLEQIGRNLGELGARVREFAAAE